MQGTNFILSVSHSHLAFPFPLWRQVSVHILEGLYSTAYCCGDGPWLETEIVGRCIENDSQFGIFYVISFPLLIFPPV